MVKLLFILSFSFLFLTHSALGETDSTYNEPVKECLSASISFRFNDLKQPKNIYNKSANDLKRVVLSPFYWNKRSYIKAGVVLAGAYTLSIFDEDIYKVINRNKNSFTTFSSKYIFEPIGNYTTFSLLAGMAGYGLIFHKERPTHTAILSMESLLITTLITQFPKRLAGRTRPIHTSPINSSEWNGWGGGTSFWSGHTAAAFSVASVIAEMYDEIPAIGIVAYSTATLAGISRIHDQKHWPSDVFMGAVIGTAIGKLVVKSFRSPRLTCMPSVSPQSSSLLLSYRF
jgi:membrane-associated phospholipid phosphatase